MSVISLFKKKNKPENVGIKLGKRLIEGVSKYYICFPDLEGEPTYPLDSKLTIGSEEGDVLMDHDGIAPRHCTFIRNQDVISLIDHHSLEGTFINKRAVDPGKVIILQDKDKISLGPYKVEIFSQIEEISEEEIDRSPLEASEMKVPESEKEKLDDQATDDQASDEESTIEIEIIPQEQQEKRSLLQKVKALFKKSQLQPIKIKQEEDDDEEDQVEEESKIAASSLLRFFALSIDLLISATLYNILKPLEIFQLFISDFPLKVFLAAKTLYEMTLAASFEPVISIIKDFIAQTPDLALMIQFISDNWQTQFRHYADVLFLYLLLRCTFNLLAGVSLGQLLIGLRAAGNIYASRILGVVRELIGFLLAPFIIFDVPTLINFRSAKEFVTFTKIYAVSSKKSWIFAPILTLLFVLLFIISPLIEGFQTASSVVVKKQQLQELAILDESSENYLSSQAIGLQIEPQREQTLLPYFHSFADENLQQQIGVLLVSDSSFYELKKFKNFNMREFVSSSGVANIVASKNFPSLNNYINDVSQSNKNFSPVKINKKDFAAEMVRLFHYSLGFKVDELTQVIKSYGPILFGLNEFRKQVEKLIPISFDMIEVKAIGSSYVALFSNTQSKKNEFALMPLDTGTQHIYTIASNDQKFSSKFIQKRLQGIKWSRAQAKTTKGALALIDSLASKVATQNEKMLLETFLEEVSIKKINNKRGYLRSLNSLQLMLEKNRKDQYPRLQQKLINLIEKVQGL